MDTCAQTEVATIERHLAETLGPKTFGVWFKNTTRFEVLGEFLRISAPNNYVGEWIERHYSESIVDAARMVTGRTVSLSFVIDSELARTLGPRQPDEQSRSIAAHGDRPAKPLTSRLHDPPALKGRLEDFLVGSSNRLAYAAAFAVAENPGAQYNPLFVHGGCGVGKTHLLQGICNGIRVRHPQLRWRYVCGEEFTNDFVCAVRAREMDVFNQQYRNLDVLVIDDVHFLANKRGTQDSFLHTLKAIETTGKQIVLASDAHPKLIGHFSEALVSRFLSGMVVRVDSPDTEVRTNVLRRRAERLKVDIRDGVIRYIAENFQTNIRELEGALLKVVALAQVHQQPVTLPLAERAIRDLVRHTAPVVLLSDIENIVSIYFGLSPSDLHTTRKSRTIALARGISMYLARRHTEMSFPEIGRFMGNKNHSTVILACRRISGLLQRNATSSWMTPMGLKEQNLATIVAEIQEQFAPACDSKDAPTRNEVSTRSKTVHAKLAS
ncbi:MAG: chromosomal replication initiator protein DnaA [Planctomycetes bacterium]|nr:chromosomal replication initiator protein DnaA [Planctomycetota bacterium]MBI3834206.1 chromosomal replication initiator protein DnaA [Planctomycetota bacterium]